MLVNYPFHLTRVQSLPFISTALTLLALSGFASAQTGLHYTPEELSIWRQRANATAATNTTNYRVFGDVQANSPGDWQRIKNRAELFLVNPASERYSGPTPSSGRTYLTENDGPGPEYTYKRSVQTSGGPVTFDSGASLGTLIRDAAFYYLITGESQYRDAVRTELLAQAAVPGLDLSNTTRWVAGQSSQFLVAEWFTKYYFAYDYIKHTLSSSDKATLNQWFTSAAVFFRNDVNTDINTPFVDRPNGDYTIKSSEAYRLSNAQGGPRVTHYNGYTTYSLHRFFNNRRSSMVRYYAMVGLGQNNAGLKEDAKKFVKDWLAYGVFPDGTPSEFERRSTSLPDLGWAYATYIVSHCADIGEHFARAGDFELVNHVENRGAAGESGVSNTSGGNKTLQKVLQHMLDYQDGTLLRYGTDLASNNGNAAYLIDGKNVATDWYATFDTWFAKANQYYKDNTIKAAYTRTNNAPAYPTPTSGATQGANQPWSGVWQAYPGVLFMSGQMENSANPYLQVAITSPAPTSTFASGATIVIEVAASNNKRGLSKVEFYNGTTKLGEDLASPFSYSWNNVGAGTYSLSAKVIDPSNLTKTSEPISITVTGTNPPPPVSDCGTGSISIDTWNNVGGQTVGAIPVTTAPGTSSTLTSFESDLSGDYYGSRIRGYIHAPSSGSYTFWISGDNNVELWLSTDENPANKRRIAYIVNNETVANTTNLYSGYRQWDKYASQQSAAISLVAGQKYYIEALHKEDAGGEHMSVQWRLPSAAIESPIGGNRLSPFGATGSISIDTWNNVGGQTVGAIPVTTAPGTSSTLTSFESDLSGDYYGSRIRGYIHAPSSGSYTFWISGDNNVELWLSTDENPTNKRRIAYIVNNETVANTTNLYSGYRQWDKYASQQSAAISLVAGQKYYIEALHKEDAGGEHVAVGWQLPNATLERPIGGCRLSPFSSSGARIAIEGEEALRVYPNPFSSQVTLKLPSSISGLTTYRLVDVVGKVHYQTSKVLGEKDRQVSLTLSKGELPPGVYFLQITDASSHTRIVKVLKQ